MGKARKNPGRKRNGKARVGVFTLEHPINQPGLAQFQVLDFNQVEGNLFKHKPLTFYVKKNTSYHRIAEMVHAVIIKRFNAPAERVIGSALHVVPEVWPGSKLLNKQVKRGGDFLAARYHDGRWGGSLLIERV